MVGSLRNEKEETNPEKKIVEEFYHLLYEQGGRKKNKGIS